jgi:uncharacterized protein
VLPGRDSPAVGIGFRRELGEQTLAAADELDVVEVTVDHFIYGSADTREMIREACRRIPVVVHGVGLSIGTAVEPDPAYLHEVARFVELARAPWYSEHLAFTKVPERDLGQLVPVPRTAVMAEVLLENIATVKRHVPVPLLLENIAYYFDYDDAEYDEVAFLRHVLGTSGSSLLLDLENLRINSANHGFDADRFLAELPAGLVKGVHVAGGGEFHDMAIDSHDRATSDETLALLPAVLARNDLDTIIVERDQNLDDLGELLDDVRRVRQVLAGDVRV